MPNWTQLTTATAANGHVTTYVLIAREAGGARVRIDIREHIVGAVPSSDREIVAIADNLDSAARIASARAKQANMAMEHVVQALSVAHARALDAQDHEPV